MPAASSTASTAMGGVRRSSAETKTVGGKQSRQEQQLNFLLERQRQFKLAALSAKKRGDLAAAKNYLRQAMGFDQMIEASQNGLPIDISNVPTPPQTKTVQSTLQPAVIARSEIGSTVAAGSKEGSVLVDGNREETYSTLERDLIRQVQVGCLMLRNFIVQRTKNFLIFVLGLRPKSRIFYEIGRCAESV